MVIMMIDRREQNIVVALLVGLALLANWNRDTDMDGTAGTERDKGLALAVGALAFFYFMN